MVRLLENVVVDEHANLGTDTKEVWLGKGTNNSQRQRTVIAEGELGGLQ